MLTRLYISHLLRMQRARTKISSIIPQLIDQIKHQQQQKVLGSHITKNNMDKAHIRHEHDSDDVSIKFHYTNSDLRIDREFTFCRNINEKVEFALQRIRTKIEQEQLKRVKKKNKIASTIPVTEIPVEIYSTAMNNGIVSDVTFAELLYSQDLKGHLQLRVSNHRFEIVINQPLVLKLVLPKSCMAGFLVYPCKLQLQFSERFYSRGSWYRCQMPVSKHLAQPLDQAIWTHCGDGLFYESSNEDIGYHLKFVLTPGNNANEYGPQVESIMNSAVAPGPGKCPYQRRHQYTQKQLQNNELRVVSYNLLAELYADSDYSRSTLFPYCPAYALQMDYRKQLLLQELRGYNADIMCLQEVDVKLFEHGLKPVLGLASSDLIGVLTQKRNCGEGLAIFYRNTRFELCRTYELLIGEQIDKLKEFSALWHKIKDNQPLVDRICNRSTTLQICLLKCKESDQHLLVANTHLYFHPDADHIRLLQVGFTMLYIEKIYNAVSAELLNDKKISIIFCGDFNSTPECGIYKLMTEQYVGSDFIDWNSNATEAVKEVELRQPFEMLSACGTPAYTNYTKEFAACLDYIFYQKNRMQVQQIVPLPSEQELKMHTAIPSVVFPSDHVALVTDLKFT